MAKDFLDYNGLGFFTSLIKSFISKKTVDNTVTTGGTGEAYTATVDGITALTAGVSFVMIPHTTSTNVLPSLDVNGLGAKKIRRRVSNSTVTTVASSAANWLYANKPVKVTYDGTNWIADMDRPNATDIYGTLAIENGGTGASTVEGALQNLGITAENIGALSMELLWENGSPSSNFPKQTLTISNLSKYTWLLIGCCFHANNHIFWSHVKNGYDAFVIAPVNNNDYSPALRTVRISGNNIEFSTGYLTKNNSEADHECLPLYIYGIKE